MMRRTGQRRRRVPPLAAHVELTTDGRGEICDGSVYTDRAQWTA